MSKRGGDEEIDWDKVLGIAQAMSKRGAPPVSASWEEAQQLGMSKYVLNNRKLYMESN